MKRIIKNLSMLFSVFLIIGFCFDMGAYAIKTDGVLNEHDWKDASVFVLSEQKNFNNKIKSSVVKVLENKQDGFVYLAVMTEYEKCGDINNCKVKVTVNDSEPSLISITDGVIENGTYPVDASSVVDENSGCTFTEIEVFFKDGAQRSDVIKINIFDMNGTESGTYTIGLEDDEENSEKSDSEDEKTEKVISSKTSKTKKSTTKKASKRKSTTKDDFTFKKVDKSKTEADDTVNKSDEKEKLLQAEQSQTVYEEEEKTFNKKYIYLIIGAVCAAGIAAAAVAVAAKSEKNND